MASGIPQNPASISAPMKNMESKFLDPNPGLISFPCEQQGNVEASILKT